MRAASNLHRAFRFDITIAVDGESPLFAVRQVELQHLEDLASIRIVAAPSILSLSMKVDEIDD